ncbi:MAG: hypothetical protein K940chlam1_01106 [Candidatus Anoxychlamydiales bacterium]|nr:hypothetical protein [Candidatus Anoxychlamydiales bacterium]NGX36420.1 hypothetical protein [Candidatus Anoxychlamydiales bacterium]
MITKLKQSFFLGIIISLFFFSNSLKAEPTLIENAKNPQISTNGYGQYVYLIWAQNDGTNDIIQGASSSNWGKIFSTPISLSEAGQDAYIPTMVDSDRQSHIYAMWTRSNGLNDIIQFDASKNFFSGWLNPEDLSSPGQTASNPQITIDDLGQHIYAAWIRSNGTNNMVQFIKSSNFAKSWSNIVDLSEVGQDAQNININVSSMRQCICAIWQRSNGTNDIIQFRHSSDAGDNWDSVVALSASGQNAKTPKILSKDYAIQTVWVRSNGTNDIIQTRCSKDNAQTWENVIDLSDTGQNAKDPQIAADFSGRYSYCTWVRSNGTNDIIQVSSTGNYGTTWSSSIDLSTSGQNAKNPQIATDNVGQNIYVIWTRSNGTNDIIQLSYSSDYGTTWTAPIDLSEVGQDAKNPQIMTDYPGMDVYAIWARSDGSKDVIEFSRSYLYGSSFSSPVTISN